MEVARLAQTALENKKAIDLTILDVRKLSNVTDFFLIVTGTSSPHLRALSEEVESALREAGTRCYRKSGTADSLWIAMDFIDVVVHVFTAETRAYYALEELWSDAVRL